MNDSLEGKPSNLATLKAFFAGIGKIFSILGKVIKTLIVLFILVGVLAWVGIISSWTQGTKVDIPDSGALRVELNGYLVDELSYQDPYTAFFSDDQPDEHLLRDLIKTIDAAASDDRINSMVLVLHDFAGGGSSKTLELGEAIERFKATGKPVYAVADLFSQSAYLLASFANTIYINPFGDVELKGLGSFRSYYGDAFDKLKVNFHVFRTGEFKDAVEPYIAGEMSEASANQTRTWLNDIWQEYRNTISRNRNISPENLDNYANAFDQLMLDNNGDAAQVALDTGLVDGYYFRDEILNNLIVNIGANEEQDFYRYTNYRAYLSQVEEDFDDQSAKIALVVASGTILDGSQSAGSIGGDSLSAQLKRVRNTEELSALVLRVDSPGGSAFASDLIRRELALYKEQGIPVVISMGSLAASGGYWISTPADEIWATPTTLTGSIGVFGIVPTVEESLETLGIRRDGVGTGPLANAFMLDLPMTDQVANIIQSSVDHIYDEFLTLVSESRDIPVEELDELAQGRVWTGNQALELGLVDHLGGLQEATEAAAQLAGVSDNYQLMEITPPLSWSEQIAKLILESVSSWIPVQSRSLINSGLPDLMENYWRTLQSSAAELEILLNDPGHQYLFCGSCQAGGPSAQP